jgi:hypothetical protein
MRMQYSIPVVVATLSLLVAALPVAATGGDTLTNARDATAAYNDQASAQAASYGLLTDAEGIACIDMPGMGAMGVYYVKARRSRAARSTLPGRKRSSTTSAQMVDFTWRRSNTWCSKPAGTPRTARRRCSSARSSSPIRVACSARSTRGRGAAGPSAPRRAMTTSSWAIPPTTADTNSRSAFDRISRAGPCSSVVEHTLGKGEVVSSILTLGSGDVF